MLTWIMFLKFLDDMERIEETRAGLAGRAYRPVVKAPWRWRDWAPRADGITGDDLLTFLSAEYGAPERLFGHRPVHLPARLAGRRRIGRQSDPRSAFKTTPLPGLGDTRIIGGV